MATFDVTEFPHLVVILEEMFRVVGDTFSVEKTDDPKWFLKHEWSKEQRDAFKKWLKFYLYKTKEARKELMECSSPNGWGICGKAASAFVSQYGWKELESEKSE